MESLEGIMNLIRIEAETRNPLHARRIQLLKSALKKTGSHSDHLQKLEKNRKNFQHLAISLEKIRPSVRSRVESNEI